MLDRAEDMVIAGPAARDGVREGPSVRHGERTGRARQRQELPKTPVGKIKRKELREPFWVGWERRVAGN
jgi:hypothetical protein